jgi:integral membrane sensor domain MASE1
MKNIITTIILVSIMAVFLVYVVTNNAAFYSQTSGTVGFLFQHEVFLWLIIVIIVLILFAALTKIFGV